MGNEHTRTIEREPAVQPATIRAAQGTTLSNRIPIDVESLPLLKMTTLDPGAKVVLDIPMVWDSDKGMYVFDRRQDQQAQTVQRLRTNKANHLSVHTTANVWELIIPANPRRIGFTITSSSPSTDFDLAFTQPAFGNLDFIGGAVYENWVWTGDVWARTPVTHAIEANEWVTDFD